jgi:hypothetical protein
MIPHFTLVTFSFPELRKGEQSIVYQAPTQHPHKKSLENVVVQCRALGYEQVMKRSPALGEVGNQFHGTSTERETLESPKNNRR